MNRYSVTGDNIAEVFEVYRDGRTVELIFAVEAGFERLAAALSTGASESMDQAELVLNLLRAETAAFAGGAAVLDDQGNTFAIYEDAVSAVVARPGRPAGCRTRHRAAAR